MVLDGVFRNDKVGLQRLVYGVMQVDAEDSASDAIVRARLGGVGSRVFGAVLGLLHAARGIVSAAEFATLLDVDDAGANGAATSFSVLEAALAHTDASYVYIAVDALGIAAKASKTHDIDPRDLRLLKRLLLLNVKGDSTALRDHFASRISKSLVALRNTVVQSMRAAAATNPAVHDPETLAIRRKARKNVKTFVDFINWLVKALVSAL